MCFLNIKACQHILLHQIYKIMIFKKASYDPFKFIFCIMLRTIVIYIIKKVIFQVNIIFNPVHFMISLIEGFKIQNVILTVTL